MGDHAIHCGKEGQVTYRHERLRGCIFRALQAACLGPRLELDFNVPRERPRDFCLPSWSLSRPAAFDIFVILLHAGLVPENLRGTRGSGRRSRARRGPKETQQTHPALSRPQGRILPPGREHLRWQEP